MILKKSSKFSSYKSISVLIFILLFAYPSLAQQELHNFTGKCSLCHLMSNEEQGVVKGVFVKEIDFQCSICHKSLGLSHITGMKPTMTIPDKFSLDSRGRITCTTCHTVHGKRVYLLNSETSGKEFCYSCHKTGFENIHESIVTYLQPGLNKKYVIIDKDTPVDRISSLCISCHDSSLGKSAPIGSGFWLHEQGTSHPIGVDYMQAYLKGGFQHTSLFNTKIRLMNGMVGCCTCHNTASGEAYDLVINNKNNMLCLECHRN